MKILRMLIMMSIVMRRINMKKKKNNKNFNKSDVEVSHVVQKKGKYLYVNVYLNKRLNN